MPSSLTQGLLPLRNQGKPSLTQSAGSFGQRVGPALTGLLDDPIFNFGLGLLQPTETGSFGESLQKGVSSARSATDRKESKKEKKLLNEALSLKKRTETLARKRQERKEKQGLQTQQRLKEIMSSSKDDAEASKRLKATGIPELVALGNQLEPKAKQFKSARSGSQTVSGAFDPNTGTFQEQFRGSVPRQTPQPRRSTGQEKLQQYFAANPDKAEVIRTGTVEEVNKVLREAALDTGQAGLIKPITDKGKNKLFNEVAEKSIRMLDDGIPKEIVAEFIANTRGLSDEDKRKIGRSTLKNR